MTSKEIKQIVESFSGIEDLSINKRTMFLTDVRFSYMKLCREFTSESFLKIGLTISRNHATVMNGIKKFDDRLFLSQLTSEDVYLKAKNYIKKYIFDESKIENTKEKITSLDSAIVHYRLRLIKIIEKNHSVISNYQNKLDHYKKFDFLDDIMNLPDKDFQEFKVRTNAFLKTRTKNQKTI